jgi:hypothetical protein
MGRILLCEKLERRVKADSVVAADAQVAGVEGWLARVGQGLGTKEERLRSAVSRGEVEYRLGLVEKQLALLLKDASVVHDLGNDYAKLEARLFDLEKRRVLDPESVIERLCTLEELVAGVAKPVTEEPSPPRVPATVVMQVVDYNLLRKDCHLNLPEPGDFPIAVFFLDRERRLCVQVMESRKLADGLASAWAPVRDLLKFLTPGKE